MNACKTQLLFYTQGFPIVFLTSQLAFNILLALIIYIMNGIYSMQTNQYELSYMKAEKGKD